MAIGTAHMASLCLPNAELHVGLHWRGSQALARALGDPSRPAALLYPGPGAVNVLESPPKGPVTLVVVDGTWSQAKKVVRENPELAALPRFAFTPPRPSEYRIRREPQDDYVSTLEALVHVLGALEGDPALFEALLRPFRAMIDTQLDFKTRVRASRHKKPRPEGERRPPSRVPMLLRERPQDLVCVVGEANAWPYRLAERRAGYADELVHWTALRIATGETLDVVVAPRCPLAPSTPHYVELTPDVLAGGTSVPGLHEAWRGFLRDTDVLCTWGHYAAALFLGLGGELPASRVDLRQVARTVGGGKVGSLEDVAARLAEATLDSPTESATGAVAGRAGRRLGFLGALARSLVARAQA